MCDKPTYAQVSPEAAMRRERWVAHYTKPKDYSDWSQDWATLVDTLNRWKSMRPETTDPVGLPGRVMAGPGHYRFLCCGLIPRAELGQLKDSLAVDGLLASIEADFVVYDPAVMRLV